MQNYNTKIPTCCAKRLVLRLPSGVRIMTDTLVITDTSKITVIRPSPQPDLSVPCIHLISPIVIGTVAEAGSKAPFNTAAGDEKDLFTTLALLSERTPNYELAIKCPLKKCSKFGPLNELSNHYMQVHANHDHSPDSDEE